MNTYIQVGLGTLKKPSNNRSADGISLVEGCLKGTELSRCPPKLFVLWATPSFQAYHELLTSIGAQLQQQGLGSVPLIGSSVAACVFDREVHEHGAVLLCFGSRFMEVAISLRLDAQSNPNAAAEDLCSALGLQAEKNAAGYANRFLLAFLPGHGAGADPLAYRAGEMAEELARLCPPRLHIFGGVSSAGVKRDTIGVQFFGTQVHQRAAVAGLITSNTTFGIGISHGLKRTGQCFHVSRLDDDGRAILSFREGTPDSIIAKINSPFVFGMATKHAQEKVIVAWPVQDRLKLLRAVRPGATLEVLQPNARQMLHSVRDLGKSIIHDLRLPSSQVAAVVSVGCVSRYRYRKEHGEEVGAAFRPGYREFPEAVHVGCYMDGELGGDSHAPWQLCNWAISQLFLADEITVTSELRSGINSLATYSHAAITAPSLHDAIERSLDMIEQANYSGSMISIKLPQSGKEFIVAQSARGVLWKEAVLKRTIRPLAGNDVLAMVARRGRSIFVRNAQKDPRCDRRAAWLGRVISFYATPLINGDGDVFGVLQIDLGDMRNATDIPPEQRDVLNVLGETTAGSLNAAIMADELKLIRSFDLLLPQCAVRDTVPEAISHFVKGATQILGADVHIRLLEPKSKVGTHPQMLALIDGTGRYYEASRKHRPRIHLEDDSPGAMAVRLGEYNIVNDTSIDAVMARLLRRARPKAVAQSLAAVRSYANFPIRNPAGKSIGFVCMAAWQKCYFTPSRVRTLEHVVGRLSLLLSHVLQKEDTQRSLAELAFLQQISPPLKTKLSIYDTLHQHIGKVAVAAGAEVASCFLYDEMQDRFVLRAQHGWHSEAKGKKWLDAAGFRKGESISGSIADLKNHLYVPDLKQFAKSHRKSVNEWFPEMFGELLPADWTCELIGLPLRFRGSLLGLLTLYHRRPVTDGPFDSCFATTDEKTLDEAARIYGAFVAALQRFDLTLWREMDNAHQQTISLHLLKQQSKPLDKILQSFCREVIKRYKFLFCNIYLPKTEGGLELRKFEPREKSSASEPAPADLDGKVVAKLDWVFRKNQIWPIRSSKRVLDEGNPKQVRSANIPEGVILPIRVDLRAVGVLLLKWRGKRPSRANNVLPHHDEARLAKLADHLGLAIKSAWRREETLRMQKVQHWLVLQSSAEASDRMADAFASGLQGVVSRVEVLSSLVRQQFPVDPRQDRDNPIGQALISLQNAAEQVIEPASKARLDCGSEHEDPQSIDVDHEIRGVIERLRLDLAFKRIHIIISPPSPHLVQTFPKAFNSLLETLLYDAVAATKSCGKLTVEIKVLVEKPIIELCICDEANPISVTLCTKVNEREIVLCSAGRAWGLSLAHRFAHSIGLRLRVEPLAVGNKVTLYLPTKTYG
jgi:signal transduction histidine kinase